MSRSSALASKATGYPIAKVSAKIALGYTLDEIPNAVTGKTYASFEPALDYVVVKIPRLPFDKFITAKRTLTTQMKATGEVMRICTSFEGGLMKALRSLAQHVDCLETGDYDNMSDEEVLEQLHVVDDRRIYLIAEISLGPEMKSTGECLGIAKTFNEALYKAFLGAGVDLPKHKKMILSVKDADKLEAVDIARRFKALGYEIFATRNTARVLNEHGVQVVAVNRINEESPTLMDLLLEHQIDLVIDTPTHGDKLKDGFLIRRTAIETGVNCLTSLDTADALLTSLENEEDKLSIVDIATISEGAK